MLLPFDAPREPRQFFVWLWEELFGDESYALDDKASYQEIDDIYQPTLIKRIHQ